MMKSISLSVVAVVLSTLPGVAMAQKAGSAYVDDRLSQIGRSITDLESRIGQLRRQTDQLQQQLDRMRSSTESRLDRLEKGGVARAPSPRPGAPRP